MCGSGPLAPVTSTLYLYPHLEWHSGRARHGAKVTTVSNMTANPRARLALGETRDVVMIDAVLVQAVPASKAPASLAEGYAAQAGWDPRTDSANYVYLVLGPDRIQVWSEGEDLSGRTVMRNGEWVV